MISPSGKESVLHSFTGFQGGVNPKCTLIRDSAGNLYGTTYLGGNFNHGTVFKLNPATMLTPAKKETILYDFGETNEDGQKPNADLVLDSSGNLYGTTEEGGSTGSGTVFELTKVGLETVLYSFGTAVHDDGIVPSAGVVRDSSGNLYGTTFTGGKYGFGTIFKLSPSNVETVLHSFAGSNGNDGRGPAAVLLLDAKGNLYGTASLDGAHGEGIVFRLIP